MHLNSVNHPLIAGRLGCFHASNFLAAKRRSEQLNFFFRMISSGQGVELLVKDWAHLSDSCLTSRRRKTHGPGPLRPPDRGLGPRRASPPGARPCASPGPRAPGALPAPALTCAPALGPARVLTSASGGPPGSAGVALGDARVPCASLPAPSARRRVQRALDQRPRVSRAGRRRRRAGLQRGPSGPRR